MRYLTGKKHHKLVCREDMHEVISYLGQNFKNDKDNKYLTLEHLFNFSGIVNIL